MRGVSGWDEFFSILSIANVLTGAWLIDRSMKIGYVVLAIGLFGVMRTVYEVLTY